MNFINDHSSGKNIDDESMPIHVVHMPQSPYSCGAARQSPNNDRDSSRQPRNLEGVGGQWPRHPSKWTTQQPPDLRRIPRQERLPPTMTEERRPVISDDYDYPNEESSEEDEMQNVRVTMPDNRNRAQTLAQVDRARLRLNEEFNKLKIRQQSRLQEVDGCHERTTHSERVDNGSKQRQPQVHSGQPIVHSGQFQVTQVEQDERPELRAVNTKFAHSKRVVNGSGQPKVHSSQNQVEAQNHPPPVPPDLRVLRQIKPAATDQFTISSTSSSTRSNSSNGSTAVVSQPSTQLSKSERSVRQPIFPSKVPLYRPASPPQSSSSTTSPTDTRFVQLPRPIMQKKTFGYKSMATTDDRS